MLSKKCMELESVLERAKEENYELSVKLGNSQEQLDRVSKDLESAQHELVTHSGQLSEAQQLLMQKEEEKEVGVASLYRAWYMVFYVNLTL